MGVLGVVDMCQLLLNGLGLTVFKRPFICSLISENQGLEKLRSDSNFRKISGPCNPVFLLVCHLDLKSFTGLKQTLILQDLDFKTLIFRNQGAD